MVLEGGKVKFQDRTPVIGICIVAGRSNHIFSHIEHVLAVNELQAINVLTERVMVYDDVKDAPPNRDSPHAICVPYNLIASYPLADIVET